MIEILLLQSMIIFIPVLIMLLFYLSLDIVLDVIDKLSEKKTAKAYVKEKPVDKTKEYFNV